MVSRSDSVQAARPSSRAIADALGARTAEERGREEDQQAAAPASTTQRVNSRTTRPAPMASGSRVPSRLSIGSSEEGSTGLTWSTSTGRSE